MTEHGKQGTFGQKTPSAVTTALPMLPEHAVRFWPKVRAESNGCWVWAASLNNKGYGVFCLNGKIERAHRVAYELCCEPIPSGMTLDHLCKNRRCVRPDHLEVVTMVTNIRRGETGKHQRLKTHCPQGHPYDKANTAIYPTPRGTLQRVCLTCHRDSNRRGRRRRKERVKV